MLKNKIFQEDSISLYWLKVCEENLDHMKTYKIFKSRSLGKKPRIPNKKNQSKASPKKTFSKNNPSQEILGKPLHKNFSQKNSAHKGADLQPIQDGKKFKQGQTAPKILENPL